MKGVKNHSFQNLAKKYSTPSGNNPQTKSFPDDPFLKDYVRLKETIVNISGGTGCC